LLRDFWRLAPAYEPKPAARMLQVLWSAFSLVTLLLFWNTPLPEAFDSIAHMTLGLHLWMAAQLVLVVCVVCWKHLNRGRTFHAFADCWTGASLVIYSYAGEKVPWVTAHIALPLVVACALYADRLLAHLGD